MDSSLVRAGSWIFDIEKDLYYNPRKYLIWAFLIYVIIFTLVVYFMKYDEESIDPDTGETITTSKSYLSIKTFLMILLTGFIFIGFFYVQQKLRLGNIQNSCKEYPIGSPDYKNCVNTRIYTYKRMNR